MSTLTIDLDAAQEARLKELSGRTGRSPGALVREALDVYAEALDQAEQTPPYSPEEIAAIEAGLTAADRREVSSHEDVFERLRLKYG
jgi:predicted transcriptional regulator